MNLQEKLYGNNQNPPYPLNFVNELGEAIIRVKEEYCQWAYNNPQQDQRIERVFAYELYHQFRQLTYWKQDFKDLRFDGEIGKQITYEIEICGVKLENFNLNQNEFYPDLVLHLSQTNRLRNNQKLIIELKSRKVGNPELAETILKLNQYLKSLNFEYASFISVNTDFNELIEQLVLLFENPINQKWACRFNRIIIMNYKDRNLEVKTLFEVLAN